MAETFQKRLKEMMEIRGITQAAVAKMSGLPRSQICNYVAGKYGPQAKTLDRLAKALDVDVMWLMGHDVPMGLYQSSVTQSEHICKSCQESGAGQMITMYARLNEIGKKKILEELQDTIELEKYTKK